MAKKSGSLFGRADAALVQAALAEGKTKGPADFTGIYKEMSESFSLMADDLLKEAKETYEAIYKDDIALKEKMGTAYEMIQNGNFTDDERGQIFDFSEDYREKFKEINKIKDKKERKKAEIALNAEFNSFLKNMPLMETELAKIATFVANDQHVAGGMDNRFGNTNTENTNFLIGIADFHNKVDNPQFKTTRTIEKGNVFYEVDVGTKKIRLNQNDIGKLLPVEDHKAKQTYDAIHATQQTAGGTEGASYNKDNVINDVYEIVAKSTNAADTWQTLSRYKGQFNKESFYDALMNPYSNVGQEIKVALENANLPQQFDVGGPKGVDESDFLNTENFKKIKKYIMNNPRFGAKVMGEWAAATSAKNAYDYGSKILQAEINKRNQKNSPKGTGFLTDKKAVFANYFDQYLVYDDALAIYKAIKLSTEGKPADLNLKGNIIKYDPKTNNWLEITDESDPANYGEPRQFLKTLGINDPDFLDLFKNTESIVNRKPSGEEEKKRIPGRIQVKELTTETFEQVNTAKDIFNIIQNAIDNKNNLISQESGVSGTDSGLYVEQKGLSGNKIQITYPGGSETFNFNPGRGFNLQSEYGQKTLSSLIKRLNELLKVKEIKTEFEDPNE